MHWLLSMLLQQKAKIIYIWYKHHSQGHRVFAVIQFEKISMTEFAAHACLV